MSGDFGTELDAALSAHLGALRSAAAEARERIARGVDALAPAAPPPAPAPHPMADQPSPMKFDAPPRGGAAVSFDMEEEAVDSEGIPLPEENF